MRVQMKHSKAGAVAGIVLFGVVIAALLSTSAHAADAVGASGAAAGGAAGIVKRIKGSVSIERAGKAIPAALGTVVQVGDVVTTDAAGGVGIVLNDNSLVSLGHKTRYTLEKFAFDTKTHAGTFASSLARGSLAMVSGKLAKQSPDAVVVRTPSTLLGVRGTEFIVDVPGG